MTAEDTADRQCPICLEAVHDEMACTPCGHVACQRCAFRIAATRPICWACRGPLTTLSVAGRSVPIRNTVLSLPVVVRARLQPHVEYGILMVAASLLLLSVQTLFRNQVEGGADI